MSPARPSSASLASPASPASLASPASRLSRRSALVALGALALAACDRSPDAGQGAGSGAAGDAAKAPLLPPAELAARLADVAAGKIAVLMVGPRQLWRQERVPGSRWIGEAQKSDGLAALEAAVRELGPEVEVVAYCGCCPYAHCPNLRPARRVLAARANARFLDLPTSFRVDWIDKGHPIDKGREPG